MKRWLLPVPALLLSTTLAAQPAFLPGSASSGAPGIDLRRGLGPGLISGLGLLVLAEQRFNPLVQRLLAERSLRALPLYNGQLFYLVPMGVEPQLEEMQIRYLEVLLREQRRAGPDTDAVSDSAADQATDLDADR